MPDQKHTTWPQAAELQEAAERFISLAADAKANGADIQLPAEVVAGLGAWMHATADTLAWLAPYRSHEGGYGMWTAAEAVARGVNAAAPAEHRPDDGLREQYAAAIRNAACEGQCGDTEEECARKRIQPIVWHFGVLAEVSGSPEMFADAVHAARDHRLQQYAAGRNTAYTKAREIEADRDRIAAALAEVREYVEHSDDDGVRTRETVLRLLGDGAQR